MCFQISIHIFYEQTHIVTTVMTLSLRTDRSGQTVQTQIRLLLEEQSDQGLHCLHFSVHLLEALLCNQMFSVITANILGVRKFRNFTVSWNSHPIRSLDLLGHQCFKFRQRLEKTCFGICENKGADQLRGDLAHRLYSDLAADLCHCLPYIHRTIPLLPKS